LLAEKIPLIGTFDELDSISYPPGKTIDENIDIEEG
jgi:hypothetical protein